MSRVALCLHGLFNSATDLSARGLDGYAHIKRHVLDHHDVDVFIHTWNDQPLDEITKLYNPRSIIAQPRIDFSPLIRSKRLESLQNAPRPLQSVLSHLYGVSKSIELVYSSNNFHDYEIVVKARFDLGRINRLTSGPGLGNPHPVQCINFQTPILPSRLYMANWNHFAMGPADMWFYGDQQVMRRFTHLYQDYLDNLNLDGDFCKFATGIEGNQGDISNAIAFYKYWMINNRMWDSAVHLNTSWE